MLTLIMRVIQKLDADLDVEISTQTQKLIRQADVAILMSIPTSDATLIRMLNWLDVDTDSDADADSDVETDST